MDKDGFICGFVELFDQCDWGDLDGCDVQDLMEKHGLIEWRPLTAQEVERGLGAYDSLEPGDPWYSYTPELQKLRSQQGGDLPLES